MDQSTDEPPEWWQPYAQKYRRWHAWDGVTPPMKYVRLPKTSPAMVFRGETAEELVDQIRDE